MTHAKSRFSKALLVLLIGIIAILTLPKLLSRGMFLDGLIYSTISLNLSKGIGGYWTPFYHGLNAETFVGHLPFFFWLQSFWFYIIGNLPFTERLFDLIILIISFILIVELTKSFPEKLTPIYAILLCVIIPKIIWTFDNNMMETILVPLSLASFLILLKRQTSRKWWQLPLVAILFLAFTLTKGPVALGILTLPFAFVFNTKIKIALKDTALLLAYAAILISVLLLYSPAFTYFQAYFNQQVLTSINGHKSLGLTMNQFKTLFGLLGQLIIPILLVMTLLITTKTKPNFNRAYLPFLIVGLVFSLPFSLFNKQHIYYIIPSLPFFAIYLAAISNVSLYKIEAITSNLAQRVLKFIGILLLATGLVLALANYNKPIRDVDMINTLHNIAEIVQNNKVSVATDLKNNWTLFAYASRFALVDFDPNKDNKYLLSQNFHPNSGYQLIELPNTKYFLFEKIPIN